MTLMRGLCKNAIPSDIMRTRVMRDMKDKLIPKYQIERAQRSRLCLARLSLVIPSSGDGSILMIFKLPNLI
ncbi:MAG: hypothetical protein QG552_3584 [Thermodesulfobacteriota bacterium]|nr:hypothetical protein [Thermodesulfobacteriota bacterium]